ncbi:MAG TPA: DUF488 domain-containing protein [Methyloceanibacter sp.]|jgi:uncharacterized protein (DUF488 family)|nr:DUF488 domain-containing protein [Methyloceanibacter sp.]
MGWREPILTIGHSRHSLGRFIELLEEAGATAVADVRSAPMSRFSPHFNKNALAVLLAEREIAYLFLGKELGGRPERPEMYTDGVADYEKMAASPKFQAGIARLIEAAQQNRIAAMCSEADPLDCHRCLLVARALAGAGFDVGHILASGSIMPHADAEERLLDLANLAEPGLLLPSREARLAEAYRARARKVAYAMPR